MGSVIQSPMQGTSETEALVQRLSALPGLREHHLWEALRIMPSLSDVRGDIEFRARFRRDMERDDFDGAIAHMMASATPIKNIDSIVFGIGRWSAQVSTAQSRQFRVRCAHADMTTSVLMALLLSDASPGLKKL